VRGADLDSAIASVSVLVGSIRVMMRKKNERQIRSKMVEAATKLGPASLMTGQSMANDVALMTVLVGDPPRREVAVGALVCDRRYAATVRKLLPRAWCGTEITRYQPEPAAEGSGEEGTQLAVHLSCIGATALHRYTHHAKTAPAGPDNLSPPARMLVPGDSLPPALQEMLDSGNCRFHAGLRIGAMACKGAQGKSFHLSKRERLASVANAAIHTSRPSTAPEAGAPPAATFRFCELFAGIGGFRLGLAPLGGDCSFASELEPEARQVPWGACRVVASILALRD